MGEGTLEFLKKVLPVLWTQRTSSDPEGCTKENPVWGQSAATALLVQDALGGSILHCKARSDIEEREVSHFLNRLSDGQILDLAAEQFRGLYEYSQPAVEISRNALLLESGVGWSAIRQGGVANCCDVLFKRFMNCIAFSWQLSDGDYKKLETATTFEHLLEVALTVLGRLVELDRPIGMVFGPITTGGLGSKEANIAVFEKTIYKLAADGQNIFSQLPFEESMWRIMQMPYYNGPEHLMRAFYGEIFNKSFLKHAYFIHGWEGSYGASWEYEQLKKKIPTITLMSNFVR